MTLQLPDDFSISVTPEITLKILQEKDADSLFKLIEKNRDYLRKFLGWLDHNTSITDSLKFIQLKRAKFDRMESATFGIHVSGSLVGLIGLNEIDQLNKCASIGYWLAQKSTGKGIMTNSARALIQFTFETLQLHRLEILCATHNKNSEKIPIGLGFSKEGVLKKKLAHYEEYFDVFLYALLRQNKKLIPSTSRHRNK